MTFCLYLIKRISICHLKIFSLPFRNLRRKWIDSLTFPIESSSFVREKWRLCHIYIPEIKFSDNKFINCIWILRQSTLIYNLNPNNRKIYHTSIKFWQISSNYYLGTKTCHYKNAYNPCVQILFIQNFWRASDHLGNFHLWIRLIEKRNLSNAFMSSL